MAFKMTHWIWGKFAFGTASAVPATAPTADSVRRATALANKGTIAITPITVLKVWNASVTMAVEQEPTVALVQIGRK